MRIFSPLSSQDDGAEASELTTHQPVPLSEGETVMFLDAKDRRYLVKLKGGGKFQTHNGVVEHDEVIGQFDGMTMRSNTGSKFAVYRPTMAEFILKMPRGAQVIYPKDLGPILMAADIFPGCHVLESGVGSGGLSATLVRAGAIVTGYELREDFANRARKNVADLLGEAALKSYRVEVRDIYEGVSVKTVERVLLDLPEPWRVVDQVQDVLVSGGILLAYTPSILQAAQLRERLVHNGYRMCETIEILQRGWHIKAQAVRPDHRMVAHTGFLTYGRKTES
jgi:tRNA (adenine57-N1/adenine58-N1)-methyltransferase catalytic subunit